MLQKRYKELQVKRVLGELTAEEKDELLKVCSEILYELMLENIDVFKRLKDR